MKRTALAVLVLLLVTPLRALAADPLEDFPDAAAAQNLFLEAHALMRRSNYGEACPKLEDGLRLEATNLAARLELADCNERLGKLATAWSGFLAVAAESKATNQLAREKDAKKRARALESRLPKLVIEVPSVEAGLEVKRDGVPLEAAVWGAAIPVDPGTHRVTATAPGKKRWLVTVQSTEGVTSRVQVPRELPAIVDEVPAPAPTDVAPATPSPLFSTPEAPLAAVAAPEASVADQRAVSPPAQTTDRRPAPALREAETTRSVIGWAIAGAGVLGLGVGGGFALASVGSRDESRSYCAGDACNATGVSLRDDAIRAGNVATIASVAGVAAIVGGLVLVLTTPKGLQPARR